MATLKELNAKKKELKSTLKRLEGSGASKQQIGRVQYKLNQVMKEKPDRRITKRKTPLADRGPSSGTGKKVAKKKAGPDMYKQAVALDNPKSKPKSNVTVTPYKAAKITDLSANKRAGQVRKDASPSGAAASRKLYEKKLADKKAAAKKAADKKKADKKKSDKKTYYSNLSGMV
tara:strand:+ start:1749 stop:2270 length:522 start_codon:yes stop_codon:yes gene_type:complete